MKLKFKKGDIVTDGSYKVQIGETCEDSTFLKVLGCKREFDKKCLGKNMLTRTERINEMCHLYNPNEKVKELDGFVYCTCCGNKIKLGEYAVKYDGEWFCDNECVYSYLGNIIGEEEVTEKDCEDVHEIEVERDDFKYEIEEKSK